MDHINAIEKLIHLLNKKIIPFSIANRSSYETLLNKIGDARIVLIGEATHGTHEFYQTRMELTKYLITEKGFNAIAIEGDWTSAYPVHRYLQGDGHPDEVESSLHDFNRFPSWMWRNITLPPFLHWLRNYNDHIEENHIKIGFYGMDLYCLNDSIKAVIDFLKKADPIAAKKAIERYSCFDHLSIDPQTYGYLVETGIKKAGIKEVTDQLLEMQYQFFNTLQKDQLEESESLFYALQNARLVKNAEHYYRALFESHEETWNIRDQHMIETLHNLVAYLESKLKLPPKIIVWAHNSHVGDARATEMADRREINIGQMVREQFSDVSFLLGFSTYSGTVTAASEWYATAEYKNIVPALSGSYEALFHQLHLKDFLLFLHDGEYIHYLLNPPRLQRAIGVIYRPETERDSHYHFSRLPYQFDALIHFDVTHALKALDEN